MHSKLILLTGMSGAGKSTAVFAFEEMKYQCIENPHVELFDSLFHHLHSQTGETRTVVIVSLFNAQKAIDAAKKISGLKAKVICLIAKEIDLVSRYKLTRHLHPLQSEGFTLLQAIQRDQALVESLRAHVDVMFDSTGFSVTQFRQQLISMFSINQSHLTIGLVTFGFKHGIPLDADFVFDLRILENPYYQPALKALSGLDKPVIEFVTSQKMFQLLLDQAEKYLEVVIPELIKEERPFYEIGVGCTGGRHRSVVFAQALGEKLKAKFPLGVLMIHRDIHKHTDQE
ncbi:MAG: RNase adapter RapZ [Bacilli bacterium]